MIRTIVVQVAVLFLLTANGYSATYYFASNGDDTRTSLQAQDRTTPWRTIDKLTTITLAAGDSVLFRRGDLFRGGIVLKQSGTAAQPIAIGAYGTGSAPVIDGSVTITGWTAYQGPIWVADYPGDATKPVEQVFASGVPLKIARFPNEGYLKVDSVINQSSFISSGLAGTIDWSNANIHIKTERWSLDWRVVKSFDKATGLVMFNQDANYLPKKGWGFFINGSLSALDQAGEWHYDSTGKKLYVRMPDGSAPAGIEASVVPYGFDAQGRNYSSIDNLTFAKHSRIGIRWNGSQVVIRNCTIEYAEGVGIDASLSDSRIENCLIKYSNQTGIDLSGANNTLSGDTLVGVAMMARLNRRGLGGGCCSGRGLDFGGGGNTIAGCVLDSIGYIGIGFSGPDNLIEKNLVNHVCMTTDDGGGIYTWNDAFANPGAAGTIIRKNIVMNGIGAPEGGGPGAGSGWVHGIYMDDRTHDVRIDSNTSINNVLGIFLHNNRFNTVTGNICYGNRNSQIQIQRDAIVSENVYGNRVYGNVFFSTSDTQNTIREERYTGNDSVLASLNDNLTGVESPFGIECRNDDKLSWKQSFIDALALRVNGNKIKNGDFDSSSLAWGGWPGQYVNLSVDSARSPDKRCLRIRYFGDPAQGTPVIQANGPYPIVAGKLYCLKFSAVENHAGVITVIARIGHASYASVGLSKQIALDTSWQDFELFFDGSISDTACRVDFQLSKSDSLVWLDKVSLYEINDAGVSRALRSRCFYNASNAVQSFGLGADSWRDMDGTRGIHGSIALPAYLSKVMIKDSTGAVNRAVDLKKAASSSRVSVMNRAGQGSIKLAFALQEKQKVKIELCSIRGAVIYSSEAREMAVGRHNEILMGGKVLAGGIYIVRITADDFVANQKIAVVR